MACGTGCAVLGVGFVAVLVFMAIGALTTRTVTSEAPIARSCIDIVDATKLLECARRVDADLAKFHNLPNIINTDLAHLDTAQAELADCFISFNSINDPSEPPDMYDFPAGCPDPTGFLPTTDPSGVAAANAAMRAATMTSLKNALTTLAGDLQTSGE